MAYCDADDLLVGDIEYGQVDPIAYVNRAAEEIDAKLGFKYRVPIVALGTPPWNGTLAANEQLILKSINARLATGRMLCAVFASAEDNSSHAYGRSLIREAQDDLAAIMSGVVDLTSAQLADVPTVIEDKLPSIHNHDEESLVDAWENTVMRGVPSWTRPGELP